MMRLTVLNPFYPGEDFPPVTSALNNPEGLLAMGGCLSAVRLENAYRHGIFPWFNEGEPILWWSPDPRLILYPKRLKVVRSLRKTLRKGIFEFSFDQAFSRVIRACAAPSPNRGDTWISERMIAAYETLHRRGLAHSFETWQSGSLVGGLYGVALGRIFFGESMFHTVTDASKASMVHACHLLVRWGYQVIDCQLHTDHLVSLGAEEIPRTAFITLLEQAVNLAPPAEAWQWDAQAPTCSSIKYPWPD